MQILEKTRSSCLTPTLILIAFFLASALQVEACEIRVAVPSIINEADPIKAINWWNKRVVTLQTDTLVRFDSKGVISPWLAKRWIFAPDKIVLDIELRKGVMFSDGSILSAEDVVRSLTRWKNESNSVDHGRLDVIKSIKVINPNYVRINLTEPFLPLISYLATPRSGIAKLVGSNILGTGPWRIEKISEDSLFFKANNRYFQGPPNCEKLRLIRIKNEDVPATIQKGQVDIAEYVSSSFGIEDLRRNVGDQAGVFEFPTYDVTTLLFTNKKKNSLTLAERKWLFEKIFQTPELKYNSFVHLACSFLPFGISVTGSNLCGVRLGKDIVSTKPNGFLKMYGPEDERIEVLKKVANHLKSLNLRVDVIPISLKGLYQRHGAGEVTIHTETLTMQVPDPFGLLSMYKSNVKENFSGYSKPAFDKALRAAKSEADLDRRDILYSKAIRVLANDYMIVPLVNETRFAMARKDIEGFETQSIGPFYSSYHRLRKIERGSDGK